MAALLAVCTKEEQRAVIRFFWSEVVSGAEIYRRPSAQYGAVLYRVEVLNLLVSGGG
jgi:hypothetical protein